MSYARGICDTCLAARLGACNIYKLCQNLCGHNADDCDHCGVLEKDYDGGYLRDEAACIYEDCDFYHGARRETDFFLFFACGFGKSLLMPTGTAARSQTGENENETWAWLQIRKKQ